MCAATGPGRRAPAVSGLSTPWHGGRTEGCVSAIPCTPRNPSASVLYAVVRDHLETFCADVHRQRDGEGLPRFVDQEFRSFLQCGSWREASRGSGVETVARSAWSRSPAKDGASVRAAAAGAWPNARPISSIASCDVPVRQWVLTLPHRLRYVLSPSPHR